MRIQLSLVAALCCAFPAVFAHVDGNGHPHERSTSLKVSKDGRCGGYTGQTCDGSAFGNCCNKDGWCGKSVSCCGTGCQTKFGTCKSEISTDGKCGKNGKSCLGSKYGDCCNQDGYCGKSSTCCGKGCQSDFGKCASSTSSTKKMSSSTKSSTKSTPHSSSMKAYSTPKKSSSSSVKAYSTPKKSSSSSASVKAYSTPSKSPSSSLKSSSSSRRATYSGSSPSVSTKTSPSSSYPTVDSTTYSVSSSSSPGSSSSTSAAGSSSSSSVASSSSSSVSSSSSDSSSVSVSFSVATTVTLDVGTTSSNGPDSPSSTSEYASPLSSAATPTATPPACPKPDGSCVTTGGSNWLIACGVTYYGADDRDSPQELDSLDDCIAACYGIPACMAVSWVPGTNGGPAFCYLKTSLTEEVANAWVFGAKEVDADECPSTPVESSASASDAASTTDSSSDVGASETASPTTTDFDEEAFLATYTYYEVPLPTFDTMIDIEQVAPAPTQICFADPTDSSMQFEVLDTRGYPITDNAGKLGLPATPPTNTTVYPFYHFETPDNAPAGFQDLVFEGPDGNKYAARKDDGSVVLVDASTNGDNVDGYETTVFTIECDGRMAMGTPSTHYVWALDGDFTKAAVGTGHSKIILLPRAASIEVNPKQIKTTVTNDAKARRSRNKMNTKRSDYNEGQSPRCPNNPPELVAKTLTKAQGGRDAQANGCGSAGIGGYLVPDYKFTPCCDAHDLCYDNCENGRKENCDHNFGSCMHSVCDKIPWWQPLDQYACPRIANFYEWFVETWGNSAYSSANKERCGCFCPHRYDDSLPADDSFNCGGCGNQCPDKTHCKSSKCVCNQDTCDNKCVDVKSHPKNCGSCGNVCSSGICKDGACYTPKSVAITNKCPADKVFLKMGRVMYYSKYGYGNTMGDVRDLRGDSDALYYGDPERYSLNNHGLGFTKGQCCDTCYSMDDCLLFYMQKQYDEVYCWTVNQERRDTLFTALAFSPEKKQCHFGGFELEPMNVGDGSVDNGYSDSEVEFGPCVNGNNPMGDWSEHLYGS